MNFEEKNELQKTVTLLKPIIEILNYSQGNDASWDEFLSKFRGKGTLPHQQLSSKLLKSTRLTL